NPTDQIDPFGARACVHDRTRRRPSKKIPRRRHHHRAGGETSRQQRSSAATMCGAPFYPPPIATRFVYNSKTATADVMDLSSPAPSSSETGAPPYDTLPAFSMESSAPYAALPPPSRQQKLMMMAEAAWGLAAPRQRLPYAAAPARKRNQGSPTTATCGAVPVPPPIKLMAVSGPVSQDVMDAGSSAPSTPSDCSSTMETTPSPRGPLPAFPSSSDAPPCGLATARQIPAPRVEVRQVWAHNFDAEAKLIESLLPKFRYAAVDTEFPGTVYRPAGAAYMLTPERRYELLKQNVDALDLIQLGLTLFDSGGRLPSLGGGGGGPARCVWEFNFREFDVRRHRHALESIAMLRAKGVDFDRTRRHGVDAAAFGPRLRKWLRAGLGRAGIVTFSGGYDLAYLVKVIYGPGYELPGTAAQFEGVARSLLRRRLFDVKEMARLCPADLRGGLDSVAGKLNVGRAVGEAHQAGSDSLLTCHTFMKMRESYFDDDGKLAVVAGVLTDITAY
uniref:poly(A)-specific ribonuclease n=1 Tax=Setaria italica TaxID=4555 RepID=K3ZZU4_SETIT